MAHEIWSSRYYAQRDVPAWHYKSIFNEVELEATKEYTAQEILEAFGEPQLSTEPLFYQLNGETKESEYVQIIRHPMPDDDVYLPFGVVSKDWELITPMIAAKEVWDQGLGIPPETMAFLRRGETLFITAKLPAFDVKGDEVETYLVFNNPMGGGKTAQGLVTPVRVVCQNTLSLALSGTRNSFRISHLPGATKRLRDWLVNTYQGSLMAMEVMKEAMEILAATKLPEIQMIEVTNRVYPFPKKPDFESKVYKDANETIKQYEYRVDWVKRARQEIIALYNGKGTGLGNTKLAGTAWEGWQAIAEFENYRRGHFDSMAINTIDGDRARRIRRAYDVVCDVATIAIS